MPTLFLTTTIVLDIALTAAGILDFSLFARICDKEGPVEIATLAALTVALLLCCLYESDKKDDGSTRPAQPPWKWFFAFWAAALIFIAMEETSWMHIYINYEIPKWTKIFNIYGDINFHNHSNLGFDLMSIDLAALYGYFIVVPLVLKHSPRAASRLGAVSFMFPHYSYGVVLLISNISLSLAAKFLLASGNYEPMHYISEYTEFHAALMMLFVITEKMVLAKRKL